MEDEDRKEAPKLRHVTKSPKPISPVGGGWRPLQKATQVPPSPPSYLPNDLWPETNLILLQARKQFPYQTHTLELCKHVTSEMTPVLCKAVKAGKMKAGAVHQEGLGGMEDLLHSLLVYNDDGPRTGFGLSDQTYRLGQRVRQSDEWLAQVKAIAEVSAELTTCTFKKPPIIELTGRERKILDVIQRGSKGLAYCRELDNANIRTERQGAWKGAPSTYSVAYKEGKPWRHRIQDEKSKIKKKAKLAKTRKELAGE